MNSYHKEATVGLFVLAGATAFVLGAMWLRGQSWGNPPTLRVAYENIGTLKTGSPLMISGAVGASEPLERPASDEGVVTDLRFEIFKVPAQSTA